ncbi:MAG TPA: pyruvate kinase [Solirubrobacterales bacterium]|jgi:pyruvate kinase|nr:pyruvate kinase [Solirubrobacterales bacterium]
MEAASNPLRAAHIGRRTKIIATVGPASWEPAVLEQLIEAGADVFRLNFSHAGRDRHAQTIEDVRAAAQKVGREVAVLGDLPGPKLRIGELRDDFAELKTGMHVTLTPREVEGDGETIPVSWPGVTDLREDQLVYLADGAIRLRVNDPEPDGVDCEIEVGGTLSSHKGMNIPGGADLPATTGVDLGWVEFAVAHGVDLLAVSFVSTAADLAPVAARLRELDSNIPLIAKIEKREAAANAEEIVRVAGGGIMVARGDLGIEVPLEKVPVEQKRLIRVAGQRSKPAITATQMLASMVTARRPTRAEVTDVANAIYDGTDAIMLSEETAVGQNPIEAVRVMDRIARATEPDLRYGEWLFTRTDQTTQDVADSVAQGAVGAVYRLGLKALVVPTNSGRTARLVSAHRPNVPVLAISPYIETVRRLNLLFGITAVQSDFGSELRSLLGHCAGLAATYGVAAPGELIAITAGLDGQEMGTNLFEVHRVPEL